MTYEPEEKKRQDEHASREGEHEASPRRVLPTWAGKIPLKTFLALQRLIEADPEAGFAAMKVFERRFPTEPPHG